MYFWCRTLFVTLLLSLAVSSPARAVPASASLPLDSWIYPALDKLAGLGLIDSALQGSRPFTRLEAARQTRDARDALDAASLPPPVALEIVRRLEVELHDHLPEVAGHSAGGYLKPLREIRLDYLHQEGAPATLVGTNARQFALNTNNFGLDYRDGHNAQALLETEARLGHFFLLNWRPIALLDEERSRLRTLHGTATVALGPFQISVGRESLWWGQGRHGTLVLSSNAQPLDMLRVTNPSPVLLPWIFKFLGPFRFDLFWSELEKERPDIAEPYFAGLRLNLKPAPWLEIGASRAVMFGGGGIDVDLADFITILGGKNLEGGEDTSNSIAAVDARLRLPFLWEAELYGEMGGEDEAGAWIGQKAYLAGLYLPVLEPTRRASLRLEYADTSVATRGGTATWYRHSLYSAGYTYREKVMGHHMGGAARDLLAELELRLPGDVNLTLGADFEERGTDLDVKETHVQPFIAVEWVLLPRLTLAGHYAVDRIRNVDFVDGARRDDHFVRLGVSGHW